MPPLKDLKGKKFHRLTVLERTNNSKSNQTQWICKCDCGKVVTVRSPSLLNGHTKSCGCFSNEVRKVNTDQTTHGLSNTRLHRIWCQMRQRCYDPKNKIYKYYGGKGIKICADWMEFKPFYDWAMVHGYADDLSIDRINCNGDYEPSNCRWADKYTQMNNMTTNDYYIFEGQKLTITQIARKVGITETTLRQRVRRLGIPLDIAIKYPSHCLPPKAVWSKQKGAIA